MAEKARYLMIGGFLGAGKTTAILALAEHLREAGLTVGLITNDQSMGLVDTAMLGSHGFPVEEITGGCFCCRFNSLVEASQRLSIESRPDVFIAEPVGSCTDLRAAVSYPLRCIYGDDFRVGPLSVLVDPIRASRILGIESGRAFSDKVLYVYKKQLEEAEIIIINKSDLLSEPRLARLQEALREHYPQARQYAVSARERHGLEPWFTLLMDQEGGSEQAPELDYELYAEGEALLGWLNGTLHIENSAPFDGNEFLRALAGRLQESLREEALEIAHLKMTLTPDAFGHDLAVLNLVRNDGQVELSHALKEPLSGGTLLVNLRAEGDPDQVKALTLAALEAGANDASGFHVTIEHMEHFRPSKPVPTYRMSAG